MNHAVALILAGGWGTRLLPATKVVPKELLPLIDRPVIHYCVEEAVSAGIDEAIIVTARGKDALLDYFDRLPELEQLLERRGDMAALDSIIEITKACHISFVRQQEQLGIAHAVQEARHVVQERPFVLYFPDDVIIGTPSVTAQLLAVYQRYKRPVLAVERVPKEAISRYGVIAAEDLGGGVYQVTGLVEKPKQEDAPSDLAIVGRYVLTPDIFPAIGSLQPGANGELQITDALQRLLTQGPIYACAFTGQRYDIGSPAGYLRASISIALQRPELAQELRKFLQEVLEMEPQGSR